LGCIDLPPPPVMLSEGEANSGQGLLGKQLQAAQQPYCAVHASTQGMKLVAQEDTCSLFPLGLTVYPPVA
jgi:hypothetical protein